MADLSTPAPRDWPAAFAALPDATPPADGWARVARARDAEPVHRRPRSRRWPLWLAAAGVAALAALPFLPRVADDAFPVLPQVLPLDGRIVLPCGGVPACCRWVRVAR